VISAKAVAAYLYLLNSRVPASAERLSKVFKEGRESMRKALKELRDAGMIETKQVRVQGRIMTITDVVEPRFWAPETRLLLQQCQPNSQLAYTPYSLITNCINSFANSRTEVREKEETKVMGVKMGGWDNLFSSDNSMDRDEYLKESEKAARKKKEAHDSKKEETVKKNNLYRSEIPVSQWKPKHVCQEFSNRIWTMHIKPWNVNASQFVKAMGNTRNKYGTDGEVELKVMDAFFARIDLSKYSDPEHLWRLFLKMFPQLLHDAKMLIELPKAIQEAAETDDSFWVKRGL
jgi:DNA-binding transcriptional ArsR family regulator